MISPRFRTWFADRRDRDAIRRLRPGDTLICSTADRAGELAAIAIELGQYNITIKTLDQVGGCEVTGVWLDEAGAGAAVLSFADRRRVDRILPMLPGGATQSSDTLIPNIRQAMARLDAEADARERWAGMDGGFYDGRD